MIIIKIETIKKMRVIKNKLKDNLYHILYIVLYPLLYMEDYLKKKRYKKRCNVNTYNYAKIDKLLYKTIQRWIVDEGELYLFKDVNYINHDENDYNFILIKDLFTNSRYRYLKDYYNYAKPKLIRDENWFERIKEFNNEDLKVKVVNKDEVFTWKYAKYNSLYKKCGEILKITAK